MAIAHNMTAHPREPIAGLPRGDRCILVIFGASGDLTRRLLMPALYNITCAGLLPPQFALVGMALDEWTTDSFREKMSQDIRTFHTQPEFDAASWDDLRTRLHYTPGKFADDSAFHRLYELVTQLDGEYQTGGNVLFYLATPPVVFGTLTDQIDKAGFKKLPGWKRIIVEKPFGTDLSSAQQLNHTILSRWQESQIYRIDHYLGKETVQNLLAFRFANGMYEPLWSKHHIDHIQFTVSEAVSVEGRGSYYERSGALRDVMQNHMFQMLAYVCMEPPLTFTADDVRDEKNKLLRAIRIYTPQEVLENTIRGQYGPGKKANGSDCPAYRQEPEVHPESSTETFAVLKLFIDNARWDGVPVYLRSGKALWARGTNVVVQFKKASLTPFRGTSVTRLSANRLIFHIQPEQGIETIFQAKTPGPSMQLQPVNMRFNYGEAFRASRATGYEVLIYNCMIGDSTLFSRTDLVETSWRIAQPMLDTWSKQPPTDFPNYAAGTWGPTTAYDLIERDGRRWFEVITRETLERVPLFRGGDTLLLGQVSMALHPRAVAAGEVIIKKGDPGAEMYLICRGEVEVLNSKGVVKETLREGDCFGEVALLLAEPRTATVRARTACDLFVLDRADFSRILREHPQFAEVVKEISMQRYQKAVSAEQLISS